jgi:small conductance mechanosensitive channel
MDKIFASAHKTLSGMVTEFGEMLPLIATGLIVFGLFWVAASLIRRGVERFASKKHYSGAARAFGRLSHIAIIFLGLLVAMTISFPSVTPAKLFSTLGIGGVAIGFAFKDIFQNLLAGILILIRQPFREGDEIRSGDFQGKVEKIETRATYIKTYDGRRIIIPNSQIYTDPVSVITAYNLLRSEYDVGIGYGDDIDTAKELALEVVKKVDGILDDPAPDVLVWELAGSSKNLRVRWWSEPKRLDVVMIKDKVLQGIAESFAENGIDLPFPTNVTLLHDQTEDYDGQRDKQREGWPAAKENPSPRPIGFPKRDKAPDDRPYS